MNALAFLVTTRVYAGLLHGVLQAIVWGARQATAWCLTDKLLQGCTHTHPNTHTHTLTHSLDHSHPMSAKHGFEVFDFRYSRSDLHL